MTAINITCLKRHDVVHVLTDAAVYRSDGVVEGFTSNKVYTVAHWPGVIGVRGSALAVPVLGAALALHFETFDELIDEIEDVLPGMVDKSTLNPDNPVELILAGVSKDRGAECYVIEASSRLPVCVSEDEAAGVDYLQQPFRLTKLPDVVQGPAVTDMDLITAAHYEGIDANGSPDGAAWAMRKVLEMQRRADWGDGVHWIGGYGVLTTIQRTGIEQRIVTRWPQDQVGRQLDRLPIDWDRWHRDNPKPGAVVPFGNRAERRRAAREARR